uniref:40S ribosomal protein S27 n=1 Tax=Vitis vinifera TaxID=29760 RepID=F6H418_VITVI
MLSSVDKWEYNNSIAKIVLSQQISPIEMLSGLGLRPKSFPAPLLLDFGRRVSASAKVSTKMVLPNDIDLLNPPAELEKRKHKLKRLVQSPNSFFMDVKCQGCFNITTVFSHSQTVVVCGNCQLVLCQPTGGRARLTEGCSFRKKGD